MFPTPTPSLWTTCRALPDGLSLAAEARCEILTIWLRSTRSTRPAPRKIRVAALHQSRDKQYRRIRIQSETQPGRGSRSRSAESVHHRLDQSSGVCPACGLHIWRCSAILVESESAQILQL